MAITHILPALAGAAFVLFCLSVALRRDASVPGNWRGAFLASSGFLLFSAYAGVQEGPVGFWTEHVRNLWGNQIWLDLLLMASAAWILIVPRARAVGVNPVPWLAFVVATGSIGMLAMLGRVLMLEQTARTRRH